MDKFAVDLDQVLNDFEYSELTDHFTNNDQMRPSKGRRPNSDLSVNQTPIAKHSITNVFNSLSEYLNTDTPTYNTSQIVEESQNIYVDKDDKHVQMTVSSFSEQQTPITTLVNHLGELNSPPNNTDECEKSFNETSTQLDNNLQDNVTVETDLDNSTSEVASLIIDSPNLVDLTVECPDNNGVQVEDTVQAVLPENEEEIEEINTTEMIHEIVETAILNNIPIVEALNPEENEYLETSQDAVIESETYLPELEQHEIETIEATSEPSSSRRESLSDDLDLDDNEINQAFDDMVKEFEANLKSEEATIEHDKSCISDNVVGEEEEAEKESPADQIPDSVMETMENETDKLDAYSRPMNLPVVNECGDGQRKINLIGEPGSTPYNNVYISKEISGSKQRHHDSDTEYSTSESPTFSEESSESGGTASTASTEAVIDDDDKDHVPQTSATMSEHPEPVALNTVQVVQPVQGADANAPEETVKSEDNAMEHEENLEQAGAIGQELLENADISGPSEVEAGAMNLGQDNWLGKQPPLWIPDAVALSCLHCDMKFTVLKRRHHCRACGLVLCSKCCNLRFRLDYLDQEARVCNKCYDILNNKDTISASSSGSEMSPDLGNSPNHRPNPNNPLEYCSTVSPLQQVDASSHNPPSVMVPVGVLKREGSTKTKSNKSVIFCDGIRPGSDLTQLDTDFNYNHNKVAQKSDKKPSVVVPNVNRSLPVCDVETKSFIPSNVAMLPPVVRVFKSDVTYTECANDMNTVELLKTEMLTFAIHLNLHIHLKIISMDCCINKTAWCYSTEGLINVGQDEIVILLEYIENEDNVPRDVFLHLNNIYFDAVKGTSVKETGVSLHNTSVFLDSKNHAGFVYIRPTFECLRNVIIPKESYLIGILVHRWETPWAKLFPLRLILRLGAEYRYYPSPIISTRHRESVFVEIGHTIINLLADFRNFSYTLPQIRGLTIHMEDKKTTINIPVNRYDQIIKSISNSSEHILAFAGNFSTQADSHLVCIQDTQGIENNYTTHAINIHNKPRKVTGASFIVFNGALKSTSGLTAKSNIVEDGLMIQILPEHMALLIESLRNMKNHTIQCGCVNAASDETVHIIWGDNDVNFNIGVVSPVDGSSMSGIPSIRVHNGKDYICNSRNRLIRWTEVFIIQNAEEHTKGQDTVDISKISESIAKAACNALVKYLDLLVTNNFHKIAIKTTLHVENVSYSAGSNNMKLPPIYMKSLDNELIPVLHRITSNNFGDNAIVLELIFRILNM